MNARTSVKALIEAWLDTERPIRIGRAEFERLQREVGKRLGPNRRIAPRYLLEVLLLTEIEIDRKLGGIPVDLRGRVEFSDERAARISLLEMAAEYQMAKDTDRDERAEDCRRAVILAKDRLRMILGNKSMAEEKRAQKEELLQWFLVWLENPAVFPDWLALRRKQLKEQR